MSDDLLERAAAIVRERYDGKVAAAPHTEDLILARVRPHVARRQRWTLVAIPLVACLVASVAWGTATGKLTTALYSLDRLFTLDRPPTPARAVSPRVSKAEHATPEVAAPVASPEPVAPEASAPEARSSPPPVRLQGVARPTRLAVSAATAVEAPAPAPNPEALFRAANRAHFGAHDPAAALELWDRYLSAAPNGSLAPEARYNRAIDLTQLGRKAEAAAALQPFARGDYGTYRQREAQQMLRAVEP